MFRISSLVLQKSNRTLLLNRVSYKIEVQHVYVSRTPSFLQYPEPKERETCLPPPPPQKPPPKDDRLFWGAMALLVSAGAFAVYAKREPEVRDWISIHAPWFDDMIAVAYQENMTYGEWVASTAESTRKRIVCFVKDPCKEPCPPTGQLVTLDEKGDSETCGDVFIDGEKVNTPCDKLDKPVITKDLCELETCIVDLSRQSLSLYTKAKEACCSYNQLVERKMVVFKLPSLKMLRNTMEERIELVDSSIPVAKKARNQLAELTRYFDCGVTGGTKEQVEQTKLMIQDNLTKIRALELEFDWENQCSLARDRQWQALETTVINFSEEITAAYAGLDFYSDKPSIGKNDPDFLLFHTQRYYETLKNDMDAALEAMTERVDRAMLFGNEKNFKTRNEEVKTQFARRKSQFNADYKKLEADQKANNDKKLKEKLAENAKKGVKTLEIRLELAEKQATIRLEKNVAEAVLLEKKKMRKQFNEMSLKLRRVEEKLEARLKVERETRRSQQLWAAGKALLSALRRGEPLVRIDKELNAIEKATTDEDKLVRTVVGAIPSHVRKEGIVPEGVLRDRFYVMEDTALKVALVEQEGAPLPVYVLSWIQAKLLFMKLSGIPQSEIDKPPKGVEDVVQMELDTFDLLQRARFYLDRGDIATTLKYITALQGASRGAANDWSEAARAHLETRQAAEAVLAHAAAIGLQYI